MNRPETARGFRHHHAAPDDDQTHDEEIAEDEGTDGRARHIDQHQGTQNAAEHACHGQKDENAAIDIAMQQMGRAGNRGREQFGGMDRGRCLGGRHAGGQKHGGRNHPVTHAERTINQLGKEPTRAKIRNSSMVSSWLHVSCHVAAAGTRAIRQGAALRKVP